MSASLPTAPLHKVSLSKLAAAVCSLQLVQISLLPLYLKKLKVLFSVFLQSKFS